MQNPAFYGSWPLNLNQYAWSPEAIQQYQNMQLAAKTHQAQPLQHTPLATSPATTAASIPPPPPPPPPPSLSPPSTPVTSSSPILRQPTPRPHHTPQTCHTAHQAQHPLRQQPFTWQPTVPPDSTHRLEPGTQCSRYGSSPSTSFLLAPPRPRGVCVEIAERRSLHGTHSHKEYSRKRPDVHAPEEHEREEPVHRRPGTISSWTDWPTGTIQEGPSHSIHAAVGRLHRHPSSIDPTTPSQGTTTAPDPSASGSASKTDWKASNSWHPPHTREATASPLQNFQSRRRTLCTISLCTNTGTSHTTITRLPSRDTLTITGTQSITTSTGGTSRATIHASPESHNKIRTQETAGILPANTAITIPTPLLQATPACGPTSSHSRAISQPFSIYPPWTHRWPQLRRRFNDVATSSHSTPRTGYSYPTHQILDPSRTPHSLQCHQNPKVDCPTQQPGTHWACPRDHLHSRQDPKARPAQPGRNSSTIRLTNGRSHFDDLQDTLPVLCSGQSFGSLTSPPTLHHTTYNIPTPATSPRHSHHSQMPGTPHTPPPSHRQTSPYFHPWPSSSHLHLSLRQHFSTPSTMEAILSTTSHHTRILHPLSHATDTGSLHKTSISSSLTPNIPPNWSLLHRQYKHWSLQTRIQPPSKTQTTPWPQDTTRGTSPPLVAHQPQLPPILHYLLTQHIHLHTSMGSGTRPYSATQITPQFFIHPATFTPHSFCLPHQTQQTAFLSHSHSKTSMETSPTSHSITTSQPDTHRTQHSKLDHTLPPCILQPSKVWNQQTPTLGSHYQLGCLRTLATCTACGTTRKIQVPLRTSQYSPLSQLHHSQGKQAPDTSLSQPPHFPDTSQTLASKTHRGTRIWPFHYTLPHTDHGNKPTSPSTASFTTSNNGTTPPYRTSHLANAPISCSNIHTPSITPATSPPPLTLSPYRHTCNTTNTAMASAQHSPLGNGTSNKSQPPSFNGSNTTACQSKTLTTSPTNSIHSFSNNGINTNNTWLDTPFFMFRKSLNSNASLQINSSYTMLTMRRHVPEYFAHTSTSRQPAPHGTTQRSSPQSQTHLQKLTPTSFTPFRHGLLRNTMGNKHPVHLATGIRVFEAEEALGQRQNNHILQEQHIGPPAQSSRNCIGHNGQTNLAISTWQRLHTRTMESSSHLHAHHLHFHPSQHDQWWPCRIF